MEPEEKEYRQSSWLIILLHTYLVFVGVGTIVMKVGSELAGVMRARYELSFSWTFPVSLFTVS